VGHADARRNCYPVSISWTDYDLLLRDTSEGFDTADLKDAKALLDELSR
jgi:hypothetical protein